MPLLAFLLFQGIQNEIIVVHMQLCIQNYYQLLYIILNGKLKALLSEIQSHFLHETINFFSTNQITKLMTLAYLYGTILYDQYKTGGAIDLPMLASYTCCRTGIKTSKAKSLQQIITILMLLRHIKREQLVSISSD